MTDRWRRWLLLVVVAATPVAAAAAPEHQSRRHFDHVAFLGAIRRLRDGAGLYEASIGGLSDIGSTITQVRSLRQPWLLGALAALPAGWLLPSYFVAVVAGSAAMSMLIATKRPVVGLAVGAYLATAGVYSGVDAWLLYELWCVPVVLVACWCWLRRLDWAAAAAATTAVLIREITIPLVIAFAIASWHQRRRVKPWITAGVVCAAVYSVHWILALEWLADDGQEAALVGTGSLWAMAQMTGFLVLGRAIGLLVWTVGVVLLWRSALRPALGLALFPLLGLVVNRPYWGFLAIPLCILSLGGLPPYPVSRDPADEAARRPRRRRHQATTRAPRAAPTSQT